MAQDKYLLIKSDGELVTSTPRELTKKDVAAITKIMLGLEAPEKKKTKKAAKFKPPTFEELEAYISEKGFNINAEMVYNHYSANGWKQSRGTPIKDWKAAVNNWAIREKKGVFGKPAEQNDDKKKGFGGFSFDEQEEFALRRYRKK